MYHTCLYCTKNLGANQILEPLPIGRRIAFDSMQGRLWVVCRSCEKWNLVPFDTRLETIDLCEHLFRSTATRFSTANIGIARLREGLELVRVGKAERPEFAAWRYGDQFGRRRTRAIAYGAAGGLAMAGLYYFGSAVGIAAVVPTLFNGINSFYDKRKVAVRLPVRSGEAGVLMRADLKEVAIIGDSSDWGIQLPVYPAPNGRLLMGMDEEDRRTVELRGEPAFEALSRVLPALNAKGGSKKMVQSAVALVEVSPFKTLIHRTRLTPLNTVDSAIRLALEMITHEDAERAALAGELALLERQWREADEVAAIADGLATADIDAEALDQLRPHAD